MFIETNPFERSWPFVYSVERGWWPGNKPSDPNPTLDGVTQHIYTRYRLKHGLRDQSVRKMNAQEREAIYRDFWDAAGCQALDWPVALVHYDCAFNSGPGNAHILGMRANFQWEQYLEVRQAFYDSIVKAHPEKAPNAPGWKNRLALLRTYIKRFPT